MHRWSLYGGNDPREVPAYRMAEAARYLHMPAATLRSWFVGRTYPRQDGAVGSFERLISPADASAVRLSFMNLVEAHVLRSLRTHHGVPIKSVRQALAYAETELGIPHLLLSDQLHTDAADLFLDHYGQLINLSRSGQLVMRRLIEEYLKRVERDDRHLPIRLYPFLRQAETGSDRTVVIDPGVSFGRPVVAGSGITTSVLVHRVDAGETIEELADDYGLTEGQIEAALIFEKAA